jgi:hypothetical protein
MGLLKETIDKSMTNAREGADRCLAKADLTSAIPNLPDIPRSAMWFSIVLGFEGVLSRHVGRGFWTVMFVVVMSIVGRKGTRVLRLTLTNMTNAGTNC